MNAANVISSVREAAGLTLRELAQRAGTSHSAIAAYEAGAKTPSVATVDRIVRAAGFEADVSLHRRQRGSSSLPRGDELIAVLELAAAFPARHAPRLECPVFGRTT